MSSQLRASASTSFASTMRCRRLPRSWWISRLPYVVPVPVGEIAPPVPVQMPPFHLHVVRQWRFILLKVSFQVENEQRAQLPSRQGASPEQTTNLEESIYKLSAQLSTISRSQKYFRTRENRNFSTVRSTERRIFNFSVIESLMMVSMAALQVFVVRFFFQGARKGMISTLVGIGRSKSLCEFFLQSSLR